MTQDPHDRSYSPLEPARLLYEQAIGQAVNQHFEEAARLFEQVIALDPTHVGARSNLGALYRQMGNIDEAIDCLLQALEIDSAHARSHANIGSAFFDKGMLADAELAFNKAIQLDPTLAEAHFNLAVLYAHRNEYDRAWNHAKNAVDLGIPDARLLLDRIEQELERQ